jgi:hypothetical protein
MNAAGRLVGYALVNPLRPWTTQYATQTAVYLPVPAGATGFANDVNACGTILGTVTLSTGVEKCAIWSRRTCDYLLEPVATQ